MPKPTLPRLGLVVLGLVALFVLAYGVPAVDRRLAWRLDVAQTYLRGLLDPAGDLPTALPYTAAAATSLPTRFASPTPAPSAASSRQPAPSPSPTRTPAPLPGSVSLPSPAWEKQGPNNCGPASLSMYLRFYGWEGDQEEIAALLKPQSDDRNVNVEELIYYVRTRAGWLNADFRVGGNLDLLKRLLAAGFPVMIEEGFHMEEPYWPEDDLWAGHYLLLTAYDDAAGAFTGQDSFYGADLRFPYASLEANWQAFNHVYLLVYRPEQAEQVKSLLGEDWEADSNRQRALEAAQAETQANPENAFAWFNLGSNLVYFERYDEAAQAYDQARKLGLPQRMLRYQFGPFFAYFFSGRTADLMALTEYALEITPNSEEALLWRGWGLYRDGRFDEAARQFEAALQENPNYQDAQYALDFVNANR